MYREYAKKIFDSFYKGDAREETYYDTLKELIEKYGNEYTHNKISVTILPKNTEAGNPDFRVWDGVTHITGYIEAKDLTIKDLDRIERTEQLQRYLSTFPNVILTNFYEFRLYRNGIKVKQMSLYRNQQQFELRTFIPPENTEELQDLLNKFFSFSLPRINNAETLAYELAKRTRFLKEEVITIELQEENEEGKTKQITPFYEAFKQFLIKDLSIEDFADLYSQTLTYGLFAARTRADATFNRELAYKFIPNTIGILKQIFRFIALDEAPIQLKAIIDDISEILEATDIKKILRQYQQEKKGDDPIIHFYETFLETYDDSLRKTRGVYYTPEPVVSYIVRAVNDILKTHFNKPLGFCDDNVTVLDPAAGTLTFPAEAIKLMVHEYQERFGEATIKQLIKDKILKNFFAFEIMMAPYAIGHLKMSFLFEELGYSLSDDERFKLYLTNALDMDDFKGSSLPGLNALSEESHLASEIKKDQPILVMMGNPPYSGHSANKGGWADQSLKIKLDGAQSYYMVDGHDLNERNPKWLQDDYVKFIRLAQWKIQKAGEGIVAMITNHGYLDNPTFRGMRQSLMMTFNEIYIIDLHGNSKKKEKSPDGSQDENVFDIQQGVAIAIFIKQKGKEGCIVYHQDLYGKRSIKYNKLMTEQFKKDSFKKINPISDKYFFKPYNIESIKYYLDWYPVNEIFKVNGVGMTTARDEFIIDSDSNRLLNKILQFKYSLLSDDDLHQFFRINKKNGWDIRKAWKSLQALTDIQIKNLIHQVAYRPFDNQYTFWHDSLIWRTVKKVMRHMLEENIGLVAVRQVAEGIFTHSLTTNNIIESRMMLSNKGIGYLFPLYLYPEEDSYETERSSNFSEQFINAIKEKYTIEPEPEEIFYYIYAVLYSKSYRTVFSEFLKSDFPRIPVIEDYEQFIALSQLGKQISDLHLLKSHLLNQPVVRYQGTGNSDQIDKIEFIEESSRLYINQEKYFDGITTEMWQYYIGGYQVLNKYLKDRKGCNLSDPIYYGKIATAVYYTIQLQEEIELIIEF